MQKRPFSLSNLRAQLRWLIPGLGVKRWFALLLLGAVLMGLGISTLLINAYGDAVNFSPLWAVGLGASGLLCMLTASVQINRTLLAPFVRPGQNVAEAVSEYQRRGKGPKVVAIGGGTGLSTLLRGLKKHTSNLTAIVTVADDGGSSGRLRRALGVLPPGDFRNCIAALADDEALITQLFQYRFGRGEDLGGHSFGNLFITAMAEVTGSFERALLESSRVLAVRGRVLPSTLRDVTLVGELVAEDEQVNRVEGESRIAETPGCIQRVFLQPDDVPAYPDSIRAVLDADLIVLGPGSLYTSLLPNLLVCDLAEAVHASRALKIYVCNTATQPGETEDYTVLDHVTAIERHTRPGLFPVILANNRQAGALLPRLDWVQLDPPVNGRRPRLRVVTADLIDEDRPWRHDSDKLARALLNLLTEPQEIKSTVEFAEPHPT
jgi:uncharacterized cofD-like protein